MYAVKSFQAILLAGAVLATAVSAFAAGKGSLALNSPVSVAGKQLTSGTYHVEWEGAGDQVEVKILAGKDLVVSTPARVVETKSAAPYDSIVLAANGDGTSSLSQIRFQGRKYRLEIVSAGEASASAGASK